MDRPPVPERHLRRLPLAAQGRQRPAAINITEILGVNVHIRAVSDRYAADGCVVLAPDLFWRTQPRIELTHDTAGVAKGIELAQETNIDLVVADIAATAGQLRPRPKVAGKVAVSGYCLGSDFATYGRRDGQYRRGRRLYGCGIQSCPDFVDKIAGPIVFHFAENDHAIRLSAGDKVKA